MHNLFLVYFVNFYMFRTYLCLPSEPTTQCIQQLVLIVPCRRLLSWLDWLFLVYFVNFYMFRAYLCLSSETTTQCIQQLVLIVLCGRLLSWLDWLFLVYFVNFYMFMAYLGSSSGGTTVCIHQLVLNPTRTTVSSKKISKYQLLYTYGVPPDDGPRYARNT